MKRTKDKEISKIWITGKSSYTIVIPKRFANQLGLSTSSHVIIEKSASELLIRKLEVNT